MHVGRDVREDDLICMHPVPVCPTVLRARDGARLVAGIEHLWIVGMAGQRPDIPPLAGHFQRFPVFATVTAAIGSALRTGIQHRGVVWVDQQRSHLRSGWQSFRHTLPLSSAFRVAVQATLSHILTFTRQANVNIGFMLVCSHQAPPRQRGRRNGMEYCAYFGIFPSVSQSKSFFETAGTSYRATLVKAGLVEGYENPPHPTASGRFLSNVATHVARRSTLPGCLLTVRRH